VLREIKWWGKIRGVNLKETRNNHRLDTYVYICISYVVCSLLEKRSTMLLEIQVFFFLF